MSLTRVSIFHTQGSIRLFLWERPNLLSPTVNAVFSKVPKGKQLQNIRSKCRENQSCKTFYRDMDAWGNKLSSCKIPDQYLKNKKVIRVVWIQHFFFLRSSLLCHLNMYIVLRNVRLKEICFSNTSYLGCLFDRPCIRNTRSVPSTN